MTSPHTSRDVTWKERGGRHRVQQLSRRTSITWPPLCSWQQWFQRWLADLQGQAATVSLSFSLDYRISHVYEKQCTLHHRSLIYNFLLKSSYLHSPLAPTYLRKFMHATRNEETRSGKCTYKVVSKKKKKNCFMYCFQSARSRRCHDIAVFGSSGLERSSRSDVWRRSIESKTAAKVTARYFCFPQYQDKSCSS